MDKGYHLTCGIWITHGQLTAHSIHCLLLPTTEEFVNFVLGLTLYQKFMKYRPVILIKFLSLKACTNLCFASIKQGIQPFKAP